MPVSIKARKIAAITNNVFSLPVMDGKYAKTLKLLYENISNLDEDEKSYICDHFKTRDIHIPENRLFSFFFFLYDATKDPFFLNKIIAHSNTLNCIEDFYEIFFNLERRSFLSTNRIVDDDSPMRATFRRLAEETNRVIAGRGISFKKPSGIIKRVAIISPQLLGLRHSPTREAFSIACHLQKHHGCEVVIFNNNALNYGNNFFLYNPFIANQEKNFSGEKIFGFDYMEFKAARVRVVSFPAEKMTTNKVLDIITKLSSTGADAVISHSDNLIVQESIYGRIPSIFATTGGVVPYARSDAYWVPGNLLTPEMEALAERFGHSGFMRESMLVTPEGKSDRSADRRLFKIPEDAFVYLVVSTRLPAEMSRDFIEVCNKLIRKTNRTVIAFAGTETFDLKKSFDEQIVESGRVLNLGFQQDLPAICAMSNAYLNPYRQGGGTSSQTAILNGLPIVTRDYGHISSVVPSGHRQTSWADYLAYAAKLAEDRDFARHEADLFMKHFNENLQTRDQIDKIFKKLQDISVRYARSNIV